MKPIKLGLITQGSLSAGLEMRLDPGHSVEDLRIGRFVVVEGQSTRFFSMLVDVSLSAANLSILSNPPPEDDFVLSVLSHSATFGTVKVQPMLMLEQADNSKTAELRPVKTIPSHFSKVFEATQGDFSLVFGEENESDSKNFNFNIGTPLNMDTAVCIDLERFIERSNGIFGKSGTGKSFLTRIFLCGIIKRDVASVLVFDMHNEYGWQALSENKAQPRVKGLKQLFGSRVVVFSLDQASSKARGIPDAHELFIGYNQIEIGDLELLKTELNLSEAMLENAYIIKEKFGSDWIASLLDMSSEEIDEFILTNKGHAAAIKALQRRLNTIVQKISYLRPRVPHNYIDQILRYIESGKHIVLEFGRQNNLLSYMLATNIITRKIHAEYVKRTEIHISNPESVPAPRKLTIVLEEAHKFLSPQVARQTIFGIIAREMRKYAVTLLVVDQRPSGIDPEILSQIGTRVTALLNDEKDIDAVFTGISGSQTLRTVLAQLDPKQQALVLGYAVPMPVVVRTRSFDTEFYKAIALSDQDLTTPQERQLKALQATEELFGSQ
jgi:DNA helicase HerA-like ATPase